MFRINKLFTNNHI